MLPKRVVQVFAGITLLLVVVAPNAALPAEQPDVPPKVFVGYVYSSHRRLTFRFTLISVMRFSTPMRMGRFGPASRARAGSLLSTLTKPESK